MVGATDAVNVNVNGGSESGTGTGAWNGRENDVMMPVPVSVSPRDAHMASGERTPVSGTGNPSWPSSSSASASVSVPHPDPRAPPLPRDGNDDDAFPNSAPAEPSALFASVLSDAGALSDSDARMDMDSDSGFSSDVNSDADEANNNSAFLNDGGIGVGTDVDGDEATTPRLHPLDVEAIRVLSARVNVLPVIARADTLGPVRLKKMKEAVRRDLARMGIGFGIFDEGEGEYEGMTIDGEANAKGRENLRIPRLPHAVLTPDPPLVRESKAELRRRYAGAGVGVGVGASSVAIPDVPGVNDASAGASSETGRSAITKDTDVDVDMRMEVDAEPEPATHAVHEAFSEIEAEKGEKKTGTTVATDTGVDDVRKDGMVVKAEDQPHKDDEGEVLSKDNDEDEEKKEEKKDGVEEEKHVPLTSSSTTASTAIPNSASTSTPPLAPPTTAATSTENDNMIATTTFEKPNNADANTTIKEKERYVRRYKWGDADALDPSHCDFVELRRAVFHHMEVCFSFFSLQISFPPFFVPVLFPPLLLRYRTYFLSFFVGFTRIYT